MINKHVKTLLVVKFSFQYAEIKKIWKIKKNDHMPKIKFFCLLLFLKQLCVLDRCIVKFLRLWKNNNLKIKKINKLFYFLKSLYVELTVMKLKNEVDFFISFKLIVLAWLVEIVNNKARISAKRVQVPVDYSYKYEK